MLCGRCLGNASGTARAQDFPLHHAFLVTCKNAINPSVTNGDMIGIGGMSCAHWRSTKEHLLEGTVWIYGFWTGLNYVAAASGQLPAKINMPAIVVEVEKTCAQQTSQTLASAVWTAYLGSKK